MKIRARILFVLLTSAFAVYAQTGLATLTGTVTDQTGAVVSGPRNIQDKIGPGSARHAQGPNGHLHSLIALEAPEVKEGGSSGPGPGNR